MKKLIIIAILISIVINAFSFSAIAQDESDKVKRVKSNVALGWTEIPDAIIQVTKDTDNPFLGITVGLLKGVLNAFARTASGLVDAATITKPSDAPAVKPSMVEVSAEK